MSPGTRDLVARVAAVRRHLYRRSAWAAASWLGVGVVLAWILAWIWSGDSGWRPGSWAPLVLDGLMVFWLGVGVWFFRRGVARWLEDGRLATSMEGAVALRRGELRGPLELSASVPEGVSAALAARASERAVAQMGNKREAELAGDLGRAVSVWTRRGSGALVAAVLVVLVLTAFQPQRSLGVAAGLAAPLRVLSGPELPAMGVQPGNAEVLRGSDVRVEVTAPGRRTVDLRWQQVGDVAHTETLEVVDGRASRVLTDVAAALEYTVRGDDGATAGAFRITPVDPLFVSDLQIDLTFPPHTGLPDETFRGATPDLRVPDGTRFTFDGRANQPLGSVALEDGAGGLAATLDIDGQQFGGAWIPDESGVYLWRFSDLRGGAPEIPPEPMTVELVPDAPPMVELVEPGRDTVLAADLRQPVGIEVADDYGVRDMEIVAWRVTALGEEREPVVQRFELGGARLASARPVLSFQSWGLLPGDEVRYLARVTDNSPARKSSETRTYVLRMPSADELRREADRALEDAAERLSELAETAAAQAEENREEARRRVLSRGDRSSEPGSRPSPGQEGFEEREGFQQAVQEQERMLEAVDSLGRELDAMEQRMAEAGQADPELRARMRELESLLEELGGDELRAQTERLSEAVERDDTAQAERSLEELAAEQERFRQRLEESLERFRQAAAEQDFRATTSEAEELARLERALAAAMEDGDPELRAQQQEALVERSEGLEASLDRLEERLRQMGEEAAAEGVRQAGEQAQQASGDMREAQRQAGEGRQQDAAAQAGQAAERMDQAAQGLEQAQQQMAQQRMEQAREGLQRAADDALALARRQGELRARMPEATTEQLAGMRADEASLMEGVENLAENLQRATEGQMPGAREISAQMGRAMESLQRTATAMDRPRSMGGSPYAEAERAVGDLNRLALMTMAAADQMGQAAQGQAQQGEQQVQQQLEELAQQQGDLVNQAGQIAPMQLGQQAMSQQMEQMSQGQQSISDQLGDLSDQPASEGALGDLQQMAAEAAELARQLAEGRLDPETVRRQERLFHRLLDAGRSLEREEFSDEREAESPDSFERGTVLPLEEGDMGVLRFRMPAASDLEQLTPGVRRLILDYFQRLNRTPEGQGGGS